MELVIRTEDDGDGLALQSLYRWLEDDPDLAGGARIRLREAMYQPGDMGGLFDAVLAVVSDASSLGSLLMAYLAWRDTKPKPPAVTIERDGTIVTLTDVRPETVSSVIAALHRQRDP